MNSSLLTDRNQLQAHIARLTHRPRPYGSVELDAAREYVSAQLSECGWTVRRHEFTVLNDVGHLQFGETLQGMNLVARRGAEPARDRPRLCVGAHLDSRPETPGADDNASAVAVLLEIARLLTVEETSTAQLDLELVAFDLEENGMLGGREHAQLCRQQQLNLRGMISLEMLGYCDHRPGSQNLPRSLVGLYPDTGDFIAIIGDQNSANLIEKTRIGCAQVTGLPVETLQVPENGNLLQATRLSDHSPFWDEGFAAVMITDTSFLRNPHYHQPTDTLETLDMDFLHQVADGCLLAVRQLLSTGL